MTLVIMSPKSEKNNNISMPLIRHLSELRKRVALSALIFIILTIGIYPFTEIIYGLLSHPLSDLSDNRTGRRLIFTGLADVFLTYLKLALYGGLILSFPFWAMQFWLFIAPGLYKREKSFVRLLFVATPVLFVAGVLFAYFIVMPLAWDFFLSFEKHAVGALPIELEAKVDEYLSLSMRMIFAFGIAFQIPIFVLLLARMGLVTKEQLQKGRHYVVIIVFALAAVITPPDIISQIALAVPMLLLFEIGLWLIIKK
jgi:sec-independent protein translocase protein TatC